MKSRDFDDYDDFGDLGDVETSKRVNLFDGLIVGNTFIALNAATSAIIAERFSDTI